jgi:hypothetical protein
MSIWICRGIMLLLVLENSEGLTYVVDKEERLSQVDHTISLIGHFDS